MTTKSPRSKPSLHFFSVTRLHRDSKGRLRTNTSPMGIEQWNAYLDIFDAITIYARIDEKVVQDRGYLLEHPRVTFRPLPFYSGGTGFIRASLKIRRYLATQITEPNHFYAMWVPTQISPMVARLTGKIDAPLLAVVIGDTEEVAKAIVPAPFNILAARITKKRAQRAVSTADAVSYVTLRALQDKYPAKKGALTLARSDVHLTPNISRKTISEYKTLGLRDYISVIVVGSQQQNYKGHDLLLESAAELQQAGYDIRLTIVGQGELHEDLVAQADTLNVRKVRFIKSLGDSEAVSKEIKKHDFFVIPSRTEGMPKVLLEAMHTGVFSIGSRVGGIPEVLAEECLFEPDSVSSLTKLLKYFIDNPDQVHLQLALQKQSIDDFILHHTGDLVLRKFLAEWVITAEQRKKNN